MILRRAVTLLALWCLVIGPSVGCLSLSLFNREEADTKTRLSSLEGRVSALESNNSHPTEIIVPAQTKPVQSLPPVH